MWRGWKGAGALVLLLSTQAQALEPFIEVGAGASIFRPVRDDGVYYQQPLPHHFTTTDFGFRAGIGLQLNPLWSITASYIHFGMAKVSATVTLDQNYVATNKCTMGPCQPTNTENTWDRIQGEELVVSRKLMEGDFYPFVKLGGAYMTHHVTTYSYTYAPSHNLAAVAGGGVCYKLLCAEATYYKGISGNGSPVAKDVLMPMLSFKIPF